MLTYTKELFKEKILMPKSLNVFIQLYIFRELLKMKKLVIGLRIYAEIHCFVGLLCFLLKNMLYELSESSMRRGLY